MLKKSVIKDVLFTALKTGGNFAEIYVEDTHNTTLKMVSGNIERANSGRDYGVGIRIFNGNNAIYAYTNDTSRNNLLSVAGEASRAVTKQEENIELDLSEKKVENNHPVSIYPDTKNQKEKVNLMRYAHESVENYSELINQIIINYMDQVKKVQIANSEGLLKKDKRVRTRTSVYVVATKEGEKQTGNFSPGAHKGFEFYDEIDLAEYAREAADTAITMINADFIPGQKMPVVINNKFGGVIFHEACGHGLEATSVAKNTSVFADKLGEKVASKKVTAIDDGTIPHAWGSQNIDDEGWPMQKNILIEDGVLKGFMVDRLNGKRMNMEPTGSGRRQSYKYAPTSRMTNTYIAAGESTPEEIIAETDYGLYAKYMGGGSVDPATGEFNFNVREGYLIENGEIKKPVRGATLIGKGSDILKKIDMVGDNLGFGQGMCGSISGSVPANVGQPTIRVSELTVGGRKGNK